MNTRANTSFHTSNASHETAENSACADERLAQENTRLHSLLFDREYQITAQLERIEQLESTLAKLQHARFGASSEKNPDQGELQFADEAELIVGDDPESPSITVSAHSRKGVSNKPFPAELPRVEVHHNLEGEKVQCACGEPFREIGTEVSEQLAVVPCRYYVVRHICHRYGCRCGAAPVTANKPPQPLPGSALHPTLIASSIVDKYLNGLPLYRQEKIAAREGVELPRDKLARAHIRVAQLVQPLVNLCLEVQQSHDITGFDGTRLQVLKEQGKTAQSKSALWIRRGGPPDKPVVLLDYRSSESGETISALLEGTCGYLVCDAAPSFNKALVTHGLTAVLCNDHARRKFVHALRHMKTGKAGNQKKPKRQRIAEVAIGHYRRLYKIEARLTGFSPERRQRARQRFVVPKWRRLLKWARQCQLDGVLHTDTRKALNYLLKHAEGLQRYCEDGRLPISNIHTEHVAKTVALVRKNFLFADTVAGAKACANLMSLLETARANGHEPHRYLTVVLSRLPSATSVEQIEALLPWNITPAEIRRRFEAMPSP